MENLEIVNKDDEVDMIYGMECFYVTMEEIAAILSGKKLYGIVADEYTITLEMLEGDEAESEG